MVTMKWNGEHWYEDRTPLLSRIATWLIWIGGTRKSPTPVSLLGHRVTFQSWGASLRLPGGDWLVVAWDGVDPSQWWRCKPTAVYVSSNGTPDRAHIWLIGAPREVREAAVAKAGSRSACGSWRPDRPGRRTEAAPPEADRPP